MGIKAASATPGGAGEPEADGIALPRNAERAGNGGDAAAGASAGFNDEEEAVQLAEARERGEPVASVSSRALEEIDTRPLPDVEELVKRIPSGVRDTLEELFRARFVTVRRLPGKALKSTAPPALTEDSQAGTAE